MTFTPILQERKINGEEKASKLSKNKVAQRWTQATFASNRRVIQFLRYPWMWISQGSILLSENPKKLKYCQWLRYLPYLLMLLNVIIQSKNYWWSCLPTLCLRKPYELMLWPAFIVLLRIVIRVKAKVFTMSCKALQDLAWHPHHFPPIPLTLATLTSWVPQLNQAWFHLKAFLLASPTETPVIFFS